MITQLYSKIIARHKRATTFIILVSFLVTFILSRIDVHLIEAKKIPDLYLFIGQTHIHHLNYGIFLLSISGYLSIVLPRNRKILHFLSFIFGVGLGLTFDEFALWVFLQDNYYATITYEAVIVIALILLNIVYFGKLWHRIFNFILNRRPLRRLKKSDFIVNFFEELQHQNSISDNK